MTDALIAAYAPVVIKLLQGVLYKEDKDWSLMLSLQQSVVDYFALVGLSVAIFEHEGFAYLHQPESDDEVSGGQLPRLTRRVPLSYHMTLLSVLLRERLEQFDNDPQNSGDPVITRAELVDAMSLYLPERGDERATLRIVNKYIKNAEELGFLKSLDKESDTRYAIRRILKAKFNSEQLSEIKTLLQNAGPETTDGEE